MPAGEDKGAGAPVLAAWALTALAGCVDGLVVAQGVKVLPVYVTGDTTKIGGALLGGNWTEAWPLALVVVTFLAGSVLAAWGGLRARRPAAPPLFLTGGLLLLGLLLAGANWPLPTILAASAAMGAVNQVLTKDPGVTFVTGAMVRLARDAAAGKAWEAGKNLLRWVAWLAGACGGAFLDGAMGTNALIVPAAAAVLAGLAVALWSSSSTGRMENA